MKRYVVQLIFVAALMGATLAVSSTVELAVAQTGSVHVLDVAGLNYQTGYNIVTKPYGPEFTAVPAYPTPLCVPTNSSVRFEGDSNLQDKSFPPGSLTWSVTGGSGSVNHDQTYTVSFNTQSTSISDLKTVSATCGGVVLKVNVLVVNFSISGTIPNMQPVTVAGKTWGSGVIAKLTLSVGTFPVNNISISVGGLDSTVRGNTILYDTATELGDDASEDLEQITPFSLSPVSPSNQRIFMLEQALDQSDPQIAGAYRQEITANGSVPDGSQSLPVHLEYIPTASIASAVTAARSGAFSGGSFHGLYSRTTTTKAIYDAISAVVTLPATDPDTATLIQTYAGYNNEQAYVYLGGEANYKRVSNALDIGLQLGHTGNVGWKPYFKSEGYGEGGPNTETADEISGTVVMEFYAPGFPMTTPDGINPVPDSTVLLQISNSSTSPDRVYEFTVSDTWANSPKCHMRMKYIPSIAQGPQVYNAPILKRNPSTGKWEQTTPNFYTSGSFLTGADFDGVDCHLAGDAIDVWGPAPMIPNPITDPGTPYVSGFDLQTVCY